MPPIRPSSPLLQLAKNLAEDGKIDQKDVKKLVDKSLEDGVFSNEEKKDLNAIDTVFRKEVFEGGGGSRLFQWSSGGIQDVRLAKQALASEKSGGVVSQKEAKGLLQTANADGVLSQSEVVTLRSLMLGGVKLTKPAANILKNSPGVIRPYERSDLAFRPIDSIPLRAVVKTNGGIQQVAEIVDDGWTNRDFFGDDPKKMLRHIERDFTEDGHLKEFRLDSNGNGKIDEVQRYQYNEGKLTGIDIISGDGTTPAKLATEIRYTYDSKGQLLSEQMDKVENPQDPNARKLLQSSTAKHQTDPATQITSITVEGSPQKYNWNPGAMTDSTQTPNTVEHSYQVDGLPSGMVVEDFRDFYPDGQIKSRKMVFEDQGINTQFESVSNYEKFNKATLKGFPINHITQSKKSYNTQNQLIGETGPGKNLTYEYNPQGKLSKVVYHEKTAPDAPETKNTTVFQYDADGRLLEEKQTRLLTINGKTTSKEFTNHHTWLPDGSHERVKTNQDGQKIGHKKVRPDGNLEFEEEFVGGKRIQGNYFQYDNKGRISRAEEVLEGELDLVQNIETHKYDDNTGNMLEVTLKEYAKDKRKDLEPFLFYEITETLRNDDSLSVVSRTRKSEKTSLSMDPIFRRTQSGNLKEPSSIGISMTSEEVFTYDAEGNVSKKRHTREENYAND